MTGKLKFIDICGGGGGYAIAARGLPIEIVAAIDHAPDCCATYGYNHPGVEVICADARRINYSRWRGIDGVLGSIPCEEVSVARNGKPAGEKVLREWHKLIDAVLAAVDCIRPRWWMIENVAMMRRHLPPLTPYTVLDAAAFCGQSRKRLFVGKFPTPPWLRQHTNALTLQSYLLPGPYIIQPRTLHSTIISKQHWYQKDSKRILDLNRKAPTITDFGSRHSRGFVVRLSDGRERTIQFTEAAKLQGFPDDYVFVASMTRAWKMVGQAVPIPLVNAMLAALVYEWQRDCGGGQKTADCDEPLEIRA